MRFALQLTLTLGLATLAGAQQPARSYHLYVAAESEDVVAELRFDAAAGTLEVVDRIRVGTLPTEIEGPHGLAVDPTGEHWYVTMAHGNPFGWLYKFRTGSNELVGRCELGLFPATMQISPATGLLYCVNFDLHGDMSPSTVSVVDPEEMVEVMRVETGPMPHGSRVSPDGLLHYSCSMMADMLYEIDAVTFEVVRRLRLTKDDAPLEGGDMDGGAPMPAGMSDDDAGGMDAMGGMPMAVVKPTWVFPHPTADLVYVALNGAAQVVEVDTRAWSVSRRFATDEGPYNVEVTPDGRRMVVTYKGAQGIGVFDLASGEEVARLRSSKKVTHGVVLSPDSRFAFVSNESIGGDPGTLDVVDLSTNQIVATADVGLQAGGIAFWKAE